MTIFLAYILSVQVGRSSQYFGYIIQYMDKEAKEEYVTT